MNNLLNFSRAKSTTNFSGKKQANCQANQINKNRKQSFIQKLLHKRSLSTKKMFTDQTTYTYKPQINQLPFQLYPESRSQVQISKQNIFQRLIQNMKEKQQTFKLLKLQKEDQQFKQKCSFHPIISQVSKKIISNKLKTQGVNEQNKPDPFNRLYMQALEKRFANDKTYMTLRQRQLTQQHTFQPSININSKKILNEQTRNAQPIYKRLEQIMQRKRQQHKNVLQEKNRQIQDAAKPKIQNKKTISILEKNQKYQSQKGNVVKRLLDNYFRQKQEKVSAMAKEEQQKYKKQCTFKPKLNSNFLLMNNSNFDHDQDFLDRQKQFHQSAKQNIQNKANQMAPTFKPQLNKLSQLICKQRQHESLDDKLYRLNYQPLFDKQAQIEQLEKSLYKQCRFHPEINQISKALQGPLKVHVCACHPVQQHFDFKPVINPRSRQIVQKMQQNQSQKPQNKKCKQHIISKLKMQQQYKQLIECTFQPKTHTLNRQMIKIKQNITQIVPGVRQYVQRKDKIMKKKLQDELYKQKIFNLQKRYRPKTSTSVRQFRLSHQVREKGDNQRKLCQQAERRFQKEHPFQPNVGIFR